VLSGFGFSQGRPCLALATVSDDGSDDKIMDDYGMINLDDFADNDDDVGFRKF
jgi:hypothetical protein